MDTVSPPRWAARKATMNLKQCDEWVQAHGDCFMDLIRIYLGIGLLVKGVFFLIYPDQLALPTGNTALASVAQAVPFVHIVGGLLLAVGVWTRLAALTQIPVLFGAVFLVHLPQLAGMAGREGVEFSALVLFLLVLIALRGPGRLSFSRSWERAPALAAPAFQKWVDAHSDVFLDLIRAYLGVGLFIKGVYFMEHREQLEQLIEQSGDLKLALIIASHYVIPAHFAGGFLLAIGLVTRVAALAQVPLLLGAMFCIHRPRFATLELRQSLEFTALVLFLLVLITAHGSGRCSVDHLQEKSGRDQLQPHPAN